jgi:hypothetical protein
MNTASEDIYSLAAELVTLTVVSVLAERHGWSINETLEKVSQVEVFDRLADSETGLWAESPYDLANMIDIELGGGSIDPNYYFM